VTGTGAFPARPTLLERYRDAVAAAADRLMVAGPAPLDGAKPRRKDPMDMDLELALERRVDFSFEGTPLKDVVDFLRQVVQKNLVLDERVVAEDERLVTMTLRRTPLRDALGLLLGPDLVYRIRSGAILITHRRRPFDADRIQARVYDVRDLAASAPFGSADKTSSLLLAALVDLTGGAVWDSVRIADKALAEKPAALLQGASIELRDPGYLIAAHTPEVHEQLGQILAIMKAIEGGAKR
jgi:hypothetical protein